MEWRDTKFQSIPAGLNVEMSYHVFLLIQGCTGATVKLRMIMAALRESCSLRRLACPSVSMLISATSLGGKSIISSNVERSFSTLWSEKVLLNPFRVLTRRVKVCSPRVAYSKCSFVSDAFLEMYRGCKLKITLRSTQSHQFCPSLSRP